MVAIEYDEIGIWSEVKLAIIREYASAYAKILDATRRESIPSLKWLYIDAFAGPGVHLSKTSGGIVYGSPLIALKTTPPFSEYHFIDADAARAEQLRTISGPRGVEIQSWPKSINKCEVIIYWSKEDGACMAEVPAQEAIQPWIASTNKCGDAISKPKGRLVFV